jgi:hypothetical protein
MQKQKIEGSVVAEPSLARWSSPAYLVLDLGHDGPLVFESGLAALDVDEQLAKGGRRIERYGQNVTGRGTCRVPHRFLRGFVAVASLAHRRGTSAYTTLVHYLRKGWW